MFRLLPAFAPPAASTCALVFEFEFVPSWVAVNWYLPPVVMLPVVDQVFVVLSNNSAEASPVVVVDVERPPDTRTFPVESKIAAWSCRATLPGWTSTSSNSSAFQAQNTTTKSTRPPRRSTTSANLTSSLPTSRRLG